MLQSTVLQRMPLGCAGEIYKAEDSFLNTVVRVPIDDVTIGTFVQKGAGSEVVQATGKAITADIIGVVVKNELVNSYSDTTNGYPKGKPVTILQEGNILIETSIPAGGGQYVFLKTADGTLAFGNSATLADHTYTGFRVEIGNGLVPGVIAITSARA